MTPIEVPTPSERDTGNAIASPTPTKTRPATTSVGLTTVWTSSGRGTSGCRGSLITRSCHVATAPSRREPAAAVVTSGRRARTNR